MLTINPRQTNTQCYRVIQLRSVSIQQEGLKEESFTWPKLYLTSVSLVTSSTATESAAIIRSFVCHKFACWVSFWFKKMQFFICLVVSSSRLLFTFHVFSFKWVLISILIWNGFVKHQNRKKYRSVLATEHDKLGLVKNCLNSIIIMRWLANMTVLLFPRTFWNLILLFFS